MSRRGQILKYLTPNTPPETRLARVFCVPNDTLWLGLLMGAVYPLTQPESWEQHGSLTPEESAAAFQLIFDAAFNETGSCIDMECCEIAYNEDGEVGFIDPETGDWTPIDYPPLPPRIPVEGQNTACLAAANATEVISQLWVSWKDIWDGATLLVAISGLISVIALIIFYPPSAVVVFTIFAELYNLMVLIGTDDFDSDDEEELTCILYCAATVTGDIVTFNFDEVIEKVNEKWDPISNVNVWGGIWYLISIIQEDGLNRAGTTTSITSADCNECDECDWCFEFNDSTPDFENWGVYQNMATFSGGTWHSEVTYDGSEALGFYIMLQYTWVTPCTIKDIELNGLLTPPTQNTEGCSGWRVGYLQGGTWNYGDYRQANEGTPTTFGWHDDMTGVNGIRVDIQQCPQAMTNLTGSVDLYSVRVRGALDYPFPEDENC